jgi:hypothetical protein
MNVEHTANSTESQDDFRAAAAVESERLLTDLQRDTSNRLADPIEAGISYCLPVLGLGRDAMKRFALASVLALVCGLGGLIVGALIGAKPEILGGGRDDWWIIAIAVAFSVTGIASLLSSSVVQRWLVRRSVRARIGEVRRFDGPAPINVGIEDSRTYSKMKVVPEDLAVIVLHPENRCLQIEGVCYRYLVYADDVVAADQLTIPQGQACRLHYAVGEEVVSLALVPISPLTEFKRQTVGGQLSLVKAVLQTLDLSEIHPAKPADAASEP